MLVDKWLLYFLSSPEVVWVEAIPVLDAVKVSDETVKTKSQIKLIQMPVKVASAIEINK